MLRQGQGGDPLSWVTRKASQGGGCLSQALLNGESSPGPVSAAGTKSLMLESAWCVPKIGKGQGGKSLFTKKNGPK